MSRTGERVLVFASDAIFAIPPVFATLVANHFIGNGLVDGVIGLATAGTMGIVGRNVAERLQNQQEMDLRRQRHNQRQIIEDRRRHHDHWV